jgi:hypothetical protein
MDYQGLDQVKIRHKRVSAARIWSKPLYPPCGFAVKKFYLMVPFFLIAELYRAFKDSIRVLHLELLKPFFFDFHLKILLN